jgi:predicted nucleic acid-binding protein
MKDGATVLVCDTSVVLNLGKRGGLSELTVRLKTERLLVVPEEVEMEVQQDDEAFYRSFLAAHFTVNTAPLARRAEIKQAALPDGLDDGETAVLSLALEENWQACVDELKARAVARTLGVKIIGTIGLLQHAYIRQWMTDDECLEKLRRMKMKGFYCPKVLANDDFADYFSRLK